ncbi:hypothetical protein [Dyella sp. GSA-30]|uniref:hypothetical protein n=1 Tax=Dyella sp. GSA-30 TaxID=2994496 RepID=UPI0024909627|nr:hypothetical protein [Dyella sp. GSA-30]BDU21831.1 hypothetical protein DYGSA30_32880 [Dyella sp. GSA-30]
MANESRSLIDILRELHALAIKKSSGFFFIATTDNHSCTIRMRGGMIEDVIYSRLRGDDAVQLLSNTQGGRGRFQPDPGSNAAGRSTLSQAAQSWLLGGFESGPPRGLGGGGTQEPRSAPPPAVSAPAGPPASAASGGHTAKIIERVALNYLGPIAGIICEEAFEASSDVEEILELIGKNLISGDEILRFKKEVRAALAAG